MRETLSGYLQWRSTWEEATWQRLSKFIKCSHPTSLRLPSGFFAQWTHQDRSTAPVSGAVTFPQSKPNNPGAETQLISAWQTFHLWLLPKISDRAFKNLTFLTYLDLSHNDLNQDSLNIHTFEGKYNESQYEPLSLTELDLGYNE